MEEHVYTRGGFIFGVSSLRRELSYQPYGDIQSMEKVSHKQHIVAAGFYLLAQGREIIAQVVAVVGVVVSPKAHAGRYGDVEVLELRESGATLGEKGHSVWQMLYDIK